MTGLRRPDGADPRAAGWSPWPLGARPPAARRAARWTRTGSPPAEAAVFRVLNGTTVLPFVVVWPVMQLGNVLVVPASALVAAAFRRWRLAAELLVAGPAR